MIPIEKATGLARMIQTALSVAARAFGVALIASPCYAVAAPAAGATTCGRMS